MNNDYKNDFGVKKKYQGEVIHVAISIHDPIGTYAKHAGATIASIFANTSVSVCIHILHDETLTQENRKKFEKLSENFNQEIRFHLVVLPENILSYKYERVTQGALFRLLLPDILTEEKIIYFDCDVIVDLDINILWGICIKGYPLAAVRDGGISYWDDQKKYLTKKNGMQIEKYFNSGVLVLNLKYIRENHCLAKEAFDFLETHQERAFQDQDALNFLFQKKYLPLHEDFNSFAMVKGDKYESGKIWHWAWNKPWDRFISMVDILYWKYLSLTSWSSDAFHLFSVLQYSNDAERKIIIFGAGSAGEKVCRNLPAQIEYFVDNGQAKWGDYLNGIPIRSPECLLNEDIKSVIIIVASQYHSEISKQLLNMGFKKYVNFL
ncbi:Lipopolysaccharide biosynthesis protein, LPS:glycosyltransferase [Pelosinus fermentans]|uniref:glycosyltransferase family 8 protein n=1 Tax=Pelosinus fermentans TaxID=365349 RepID=UPI0002685EB3|nr:glycosyltransferase family 8 protein [Pelosinus fermentans]OAM92862.1 glycosyl transferase family 8 [Pelosinus fermentans DSM 17108]SDQ59225.1 Lipopolysaccharide biosynthesis protein, LPS:glycosyltransferase [Pelosinus fermentans]